MWVWDDRTQGWTDVAEPVGGGTGRHGNRNIGPPARTPERLIRKLGGLASSDQLRSFSRSELNQALASGAVVRLRRGRYALPSVDAAVSVAASVGGVLCLTSAALHHGWPVVWAPDMPHLLFGKHRRLDPGIRNLAHVHWRDLAPGDVEGIATSRPLTLVQCFRYLPEAEALAVADSAARSGDHSALAECAAVMSGPRAPRIRHFASRARGEADSPFESVLRCLVDRVSGCRFEPQITISSVRPAVRPDLVDQRLRIALEADSFEWHGSRSALRDDARRYNALIADGWLVLRFSWEDVMFDHGAVVATVAAAVRLRA